VATALRDDVRLIAVVMGHSRNRERFALARQLLEDGFARTRRVTCLTEGQPLDITIPVDYGEIEEVALCAGENLSVVVRENDLTDLKLVTDQPERLQAPLAAGTELGEARVQLGDRVLGRVPLVAGQDVHAASFKQKLKRSVRSGIKGLFDRSG
jgi:D-alanyl-D-alanine carboxypeptidase